MSRLLIPGFFNSTGSDGRLADLKDGGGPFGGFVAFI